MSTIAPPTTTDHQPIPIEVSVRFERRATLYKMLDTADERLRYAQRVGDDVGSWRWDHRHRVIWDEIDRRDRIAAERELRKQRRMETAAVIYRETGQVRL